MTKCDELSCGSTDLKTGQRVYVVYGLPFDERYGHLRHTFEGFKRAGAIVVHDEEFMVLSKTQVSRTDVVVNYFSNRNVFEAVEPRNRWCFLVDERAESGNNAYASRLKSFFKQQGCSKAIITYANESHIKELSDNGISHVYLPHSTPAPRPRVDKTGTVVSCGALDASYYPVRTILHQALKDVPGSSGGHGHALTGEAYLSWLDTFEVGIVDRAGPRDRMVSKYVEFGACHVLPIGDCPTYMPAEMKGLMVCVRDEKQAHSETMRLLAGDRRELHQRQDGYTEACHRHFDLNKNCTIVSALKSGCR